MLNLLEEVFGFMVELGASVYNFLTLCLLFVWDILVILHTEMPRLEGLLAGVFLAWLLARREKNSLMKAISFPMKLVLDVLDLIWDKGLEYTSSGVKKSFEVIKKPFSFAWKKAKEAYAALIDAVKGLKDKISK